METGFVWPRVPSQLQVRSFLVGSALFWAERRRACKEGFEIFLEVEAVRSGLNPRLNLDQKSGYHIDGFRCDAVSAMMLGTGYCDRLG